MPYQYDISGGGSGFSAFDPSRWDAEHESPYTGELGKQYLDSQLAPIQSGLESQEGLAYKEGDEGGLIGKFSTAGKVAGARSNAALARSSIIGRYNMLAAAAKERRDMTLENQEYGASEAEKGRMFSDYMGRIGRDWQDKQRINNDRVSKISGEQGMLEGAGMDFAAQFVNPSATIGKAMSGKGYAPSGGGGGGGGGYDFGSGAYGSEYSDYGYGMPGYEASDYGFTGGMSSVSGSGAGMSSEGMLFF